MVQNVCVLVTYWKAPLTCQSPRPFTTTKAGPALPLINVGQRHRLDLHNAEFWWTICPKGPLARLPGLVHAEQTVQTVHRVQTVHTVHTVPRLSGLVAAV